MKKLNYRDYMKHYTSVHYAYGKPSQTKVAIEEEIVRIMEDCGGYDYRVMSKNCFHFTAAFLKDVICMDTGEVMYTELHYFTPSRWDTITKVELEF